MLRLKSANRNYNLLIIERVIKDFLYFTMHGKQFISFQG